MFVYNTRARARQQANLLYRRDVAPGITQRNVPRGDYYLPSLHMSDLIAAVAVKIVSRRYPMKMVHRMEGEVEIRDRFGWILLVSVYLMV
jgi:hypothetical protein